MPRTYEEMKYAPAERERSGEYVECAYCGKEFYNIPSRKGRKFCSRECYDASRAPNMVTKVCPTCGKEFSVPVSIADRYTHCSWECRAHVKDTYICERCGKPFESHETRWTPRFCSEECRRPPLIVECKNCGEEFRKEPADTDRQFCCFACYRAYQGETLLEKTIRQALDQLGIEYIQEAPIGRYSVDFLLPEARIALEVDGEYWHQNAARDARKNRYLFKRGWRVCRISDRKVNNASSVQNLVVKRLKAVSNLEITPLQPPLF